MSYHSINFIYILLFSSSIIHCLKKYNVIYIPFKTKSLRFDLDDDYEYIENNNKNVNPSSFLNKWFYNGIYSYIQIGTPSKTITSFYDFGNSKFSIGKCDENKGSTSYILTKDKFFNSKSFTKNEIKDKNNNYIYTIGNEYFEFYDTSNYHSIINLNHEQKGMNFFYDDNFSDKKLCGNIGLNININNNENNYNFIEQLKKKKVISKNIWTLDYQTLSRGNIIIGAEPHFYETNKNFYSQYKTIYVNLNKNNNNFWSFDFDKIFLNGTINISLKDTKAEFLIDHGLIIGTEEYKDILEQTYFNKLINDGICFKEIAKLKNTNDEYIIYYCDKVKFKGSSFLPDKDKPYIKFNDIYLSHKGFEYIFKIGKYDLFEEIDQKLFFLIIFDKNNKNKIWKLGEPFISLFKFVFNQEQKTIGFYNPLLERISNSEIIFDEKEINSNNTYINNNNFSATQVIFNYIKNILFIILSLLIIIYIIRKIFIKRKIRANELVENYDYLTNLNNKDKNEINTNKNTKNNLGISLKIN